MKSTPILQSKVFRPQAILFDYDGVLVSSEPIHLAAWMQLLKELGLPEDQETVKKGIGKTAPEVIATVLNRYRPDWTSEHYDVHELARRKNVFYISLAEQKLALYPGVKEGLEWLRSKNILCAVVSNGKRTELHRTMKHLGIFDCFDEIVSRDDVTHFKPDPTPYLFGAATLGVDPSECIAIEDSPPGIQAALMAKVPAAAVLTNFSREVMSSPVLGRPDLKPDWIFESIHDFFKELIERVDRKS